MILKNDLCNASHKLVHRQKAHDYLNRCRKGFQQDTLHNSSVGETRNTKNVSTYKSHI